jgi:hypothetical protein
MRNNSSRRGIIQPTSQRKPAKDLPRYPSPPSTKGPDLSGKAIAPKLFHTSFARFLDKATRDESSALNTYIHRFQRLYPCGEWAEHFRVI